MSKQSASWHMLPISELVDFILQNVILEMVIEEILLYLRNDSQLRNQFPCCNSMDH